MCICTINYCILADTEIAQNDSHYTAAAAAAVFILQATELTKHNWCWQFELNEPHIKGRREKQDHSSGSFTIMEWLKKLKVGGSLKDS